MFVQKLSKNAKSASTSNRTASPSLCVTDKTYGSNTKSDMAHYQSTHSFSDHGKEQSDDSGENPKTCEIKPGRVTLIEISKKKMGLGLSVVGGSDTPLVSRFLKAYKCNLAFYNLYYCG